MNLIKAFPCFVFALSVLSVPLATTYANPSVDEPNSTLEKKASKLKRVPHKKNHAKKKRSRKPAKLSPSYKQSRNRWHTEATDSERHAFARKHLPPLVLRPIEGKEIYELEPQDEHGGFAESERLKADMALAYKRGHLAHPISGRLLDLLYRTMVHFDVPYIWVVSGYRPSRSTSRHSQGRAVDMVLPGVSDENLATYLRTLGFVGVGIYPQSGFVHLDVREQSYFWVDRSLPGRRSRVRPILGGAAKQADIQARARGQTPVDEVDSVPIMEAWDDDWESWNDTPSPELLHPEEDSTHQNHEE